MGWVCERGLHRRGNQLDHAAPRARQRVPKDRRVAMDGRLAGTVGRCEDLGNEGPSRAHVHERPSEGASYGNTSSRSSWAGTRAESRTTSPGWSNADSSCVSASTHGALTSASRQLASARSEPRARVTQPPYAAGSLPRFRRATGRASSSFWRDFLSLGSVREAAGRGVSVGCTRCRCC